MPAARVTETTRSAVAVKLTTSKGTRFVQSACRPHAERATAPFGVSKVSPYHSVIPGTPGPDGAPPDAEFEPASGPISTRGPKVGIQPSGATFVTTPWALIVTSKLPFEIVADTGVPEVGPDVPDDECADGGRPVDCARAGGGARSHAVARRAKGSAEIGAMAGTPKLGG